MKKRLAILGSTGSIGENTLHVVEHLGDYVSVVGVAAGTRVKRLAAQAATFDCEWASAAFADTLPLLQSELPSTCQAIAGGDALCEKVCADNVDIVLCAIVGTAGLKPVLAAIRAGKDIALASKEILVMAGDLVMSEARRHGVRILPVDSEHSAVFQCLDGRNIKDVQRLVLTASGGPFRDASTKRLRKVTPADALRHPTWDMGAKITIDSATLMNKALEIIEAHWLFDVAADRIDVVIHPQSIIHSMVEFRDGSMLAQMGNPDMRLPIQYALTYPERAPSLITPMDFGHSWPLTLEPPDHKRFPALMMAKEALAAGGTLPAVLNAANEVAVAKFCEGALPFPGIWETVAEVMREHRVCDSPALDAILAADSWARAETEAMIRGRQS